jgi:hypothetical protein
MKENKENNCRKVKFTLYFICPVFSFGMEVVVFNIRKYWLRYTDASCSNLALDLVWFVGEKTRCHVKCVMRCWKGCSDINKRLILELI